MKLFIIATERALKLESPVRTAAHFKMRIVRKVLYILLCIVLIISTDVSGSPTPRKLTPDCVTCGVPPKPCPSGQRRSKVTGKCVPILRN